MSIKTCIICGNEFEHSLPQTKRCPQCRNKLTKDQKQLNLKNQKAYRFKQSNGMSIEQYNEMYVQQKGCCKLCGRLNRELAINRNQSSGKVINLLCQHCIELIEFVNKYTDEIITYLEHKDLVTRKIKL